MEGNLATHPLAEILRELAAETWSGAVRLSSERVKAVLYFDSGVLSNAASNLRQYRLAELLQRSGQATAQQINDTQEAQGPDLKLAQALLSNETVSLAAIETALAWQATEILKLAWQWPAGEWKLEPNVRPAGSLRLNVPMAPLLVNAARQVPYEIVKTRFTNDSEEFSPLPCNLQEAPLQPKEAFLLTRLEGAMSLGELMSLSGLSEQAAHHALYVLTLGGFVRRAGWPSALAKIAAPLPVKTTSIEVKPEQNNGARAQRELDSFLARMELAQDFYQMLGLEPDAAAPDIKASYYQAARKFHPDLFRNADAALHKRIESEFTKLTRAYETLKDAASRSRYDAKLRSGNPAAAPPKPPPPASAPKPPPATAFPSQMLPKPPVLPARPPVAQFPRSAASPVANRPVAPFLAKEPLRPLAPPPAPAPAPPVRVAPPPPVPLATEKISAQQAQWADNQFKRGVTALASRDYISAIVCLGEAVRLNPNEGRYRAYFGRALSGDPNSRRQAEVEFIAAIRLEPSNLDYPLMLAEFYWNMNFPLRAQGELRRVLSKDPFKQEAINLRNKFEAALLKK